MSKKAKDVFICHSAKDELFKSFIEKVLLDGLFKNIKDKVRYTSHTEHDLKPDQRLNELLEEICTCRIFIVFLSKNFKSSQWCTIENIFAYYREKFSKRELEQGIKIFIVKDEFFDDEDIFPYESDRIFASFDKEKIKNFVDLYDLCKDNLILEGEKDLIEKKSFSTLVSEFFNNDYQKLLEKTKPFTVRDNIYNTIINSFSNKSNLDFPVTLFSKLKDYVELSMKTADMARAALIWTVYKSPLQIEKTRLGENYLTDYDDKFVEVKSLYKVRLVIFDSYDDANKYHKIDDDNSEVYRKRAFEEANGNYLYFTTKQKLNEWVIDETEFKNGLPEGFDYEFGFVQKSNKSLSSSMFFTSGFNSKAKSEEYHHLIFSPYNIDKKLYGSFEQLLKAPNTKIKAKLNTEYTIFEDIPIQMELIYSLKSIPNCTLFENNYIVKYPLDQTKLEKLHEKVHH